MKLRDMPPDVIVCVVSPALTVPGQFEAGDPPSCIPPALPPLELLLPELSAPELEAPELLLPELPSMVTPEPLSREPTELLPEVPAPELPAPELVLERPPPELLDAPALEPEPDPPPELLVCPSELLASNSVLLVADGPHAKVENGAIPARRARWNAAMRGLLTFMVHLRSPAPMKGRLAGRILPTGYMFCLAATGD
jgi:hypothetical protein